MTGFTPSGTTVYTNTATMTATGVSNPSGVSSVLFAVWNQVDGTQNYVAYSGTNIGGGTWRAVFDRMRHATKTGTFYVNVWGTDLYGNVGCMGTYSFTVQQDILAPTMTGFFPVNMTI